MFTSSDDFASLSKPNEPVIQSPRFLDWVLGIDRTADALLVPGALQAIALEEGEVAFTLSLVRKKPLPGGLYFEKEDEAVEGALHCRLRFYTRGVLRLLVSPTPRHFREESPMLAWEASLHPVAARLEGDGERWRANGEGGAWFAVESRPFAPAFSPDGQVDLRFQGHDQFLENLLEAFPLLCLERGDGSRLLGFALHVRPGERFAGTGERFERPDLFGQQVELVNYDAAGVNNPRAYKNVPFLLSSRGYGLFVHSTARMRLDIGAHSTRSLQWLVEDEALDLFVIGGGSLAAALLNYRRITGFPAMPPLWSFGVWMSRASYSSDSEASAVAQRMRAEGFPADVIHLDIGWFKKEWRCDWQFSPETFPDPADFLRRMDELGFQVSLWQIPHLHPSLEVAQEALERGYVGRETAASQRHWLGYTLDFTNPQAVAWYQEKLATLLRMGAAAIKADFGEEVDEGALYAGLAGAKYRNLFALLYQKAVWEVSERVRGQGQAVIWARSAWAGSQRYPVHWGGDAAATYDGLAGTLRGGLHFGLSGFSFWSHDVGGIHGIPDFMGTRPSDDLYVRWTQVGVFSSHMRFHGGTPREPWEYPAVAGIVRQWLRFRYALLPYVLEQAQRSIRSGLPMLRSLVLEWPHDPAAWSLADQYLFGDAFLVCPVLDPSGVRAVYLPEGEWVDFWSGEALVGPRLLGGVASPLERLPLYLRRGSRVTFAEAVINTRQLPQARRVTLRFDEGYGGFARSPLADWIAL